MALLEVFLRLSSDDLIRVYLHGQVCQHLQVLSLAFFMWTWTVSLFLWGFDIDQNSKVRLCLFKWCAVSEICSFVRNCLIHPVGAPGRTNGFLAGKPVAVTSNRGVGRVPRRAGANPQLEQQYYQNKQSHLQSGECVTPIVFVMGMLTLIFIDLDRCISCTSLYMSYFVVTSLFCLSEREDEDLYRTPSQESPDSHTNGVDQDPAALSMAEIASCSYEARQGHSYFK